mgnify:CR=1 FL=1
MRYQDSLCAPNRASRRGKGMADDSDPVLYDTGVSDDVGRDETDVSKLLEKSGVKSKMIGGAKVWENHANFIVNIGYATSGDVLKLMYKMYSEVKERYTIELHPEVKFIGIANEEEQKIWKTMTEH